MPREIWNEGRVVGYSAYEIYVKQHLSEDPTTPAATEREWLASSLAMGSSMLLKVPNSTGNPGPGSHTFVDIPLPPNTKLAAANTIIAQFFDGDGVFAANGNWATRISDYGQLISNTQTSSPTGEITAANITQGVPRQSLTDWSDNKKTKLKDYMKIYDGIVIQPGTWVDWGGSTPKKDFQANLSRPYPTVRLHIRGKITSNPLILLTGFTIRSVLSGTVGQDTSLQTDSPDDGDFLGPATFPWAAKIVFSVPTSYITYFATGDYERKIPKGSTVASKLVQDTPIIDMQTSKPETFYNKNTVASEYGPDYIPASSRTTYDVIHFATLGDGEAVLTVYQRDSACPPALYGTFVTQNGDNYLNPIDIVAPGSVKLFTNVNANKLLTYQTTFPGTTAINLTSSGLVKMYKKLNGSYTEFAVSNIEISYLNSYSWKTNPRGEYNSYFAAPDIDLQGTDRPKLVKLKAGLQTAYALMMSESITSNGSDPNFIKMRKCPDIGEDKQYAPYPVKLAHIIASCEQKVDNPALHLRPEWNEHLLKPGEDPRKDESYENVESFNNLNWTTLMVALTQNRSIDILGSRLKMMKYTLTHDQPDESHPTGPYMEFGPPDIMYTEQEKTIYYVYDPGYPEAEWDSTKERWYITRKRQWYKNPSVADSTNNHVLRFYVTNSCPATTDVPEGSIGIGWGFASPT